MSQFTPALCFPLVISFDTMRRSFKLASIDNLSMRWKRPLLAALAYSRSASEFEFATSRTANKSRSRQRRSHQLVGEMSGWSSDAVATSREGHHQPISDLAVQHPALRTLEPPQRLRLMRVKPSRTQKCLCISRHRPVVLAAVCHRRPLNRPFCDGHHIRCPKTRPTI